MGLGRAGGLDFFVGHTVLVLAGTGSFTWEQRACVRALGLKHKDPRAPLSIRADKEPRSPCAVEALLSPVTQEVAGYFQER